MSFPAYPEYKNSGADWLGKVPSHWAVIAARRVFRQRREKSCAQDEQLSVTQRHGVVPQKLFMKIEDQKVTLALSGIENFRRVETDDFVISLRSFQGGIERSKYEGCVSPAYTVMQFTNRQSAEFFAYVLKSGAFISVLQSKTDGIRDGKSISYDQFGTIDLPIPEINEQQAIAAFLDRETAKIDALVAEQERLIELLKEKRQAVISHAVTKGLDPNVPMKDSGIEWLGEVPEHWSVAPLRYVLSEPLVYGANEAADDDTREHPRFVRITDIDQDGDLKGDTFRSLPPEVAQQYLLIEGDVLLARSGATVGKSFIYKTTWGVCCFAGYLIRARVNQDVISAQFLYECCQSTFYWQYIASEQIQATIQNISAQRYGRLLLPLPPLKEQQQIVRHIAAERERLGALLKEAMDIISLLKERRAALISAAVTGKIDVRGLIPENTSSQNLETA